MCIAVMLSSGQRPSGLIRSTRHQGDDEAVKHGPLTFSRWNLACLRPFAEGSCALIAGTCFVRGAENPLACTSQRAGAFRQPGRRAAARKPQRTATRHSPHRARCLRAGRSAAHLHRRRSLRGQGILPPRRDGVRGRDHAVAGRELPGAPQDPARRRRGIDRDGGRRRSRLHDRADLFATDGMEHIGCPNWGRC